MKGRVGEIRKEDCFQVFGDNIRLIQKLLYLTSNTCVARSAGGRRRKNTVGPHLTWDTTTHPRPTLAARRGYMKSVLVLTMVATATLGSQFVGEPMEANLKVQSSSITLDRK